MHTSRESHVDPDGEADCHTNIYVVVGPPIVIIYLKFCSIQLDLSFTLH